MNGERLRILELIESGDISVQEGVERLEDLSSEESATVLDRFKSGDQPLGDQGLDEGLPVESPVPPLLRWVWRGVFGFGVVVMAVGGLLLARAYGPADAPGLVWGWVLFTLGVIVMLLGWWLQRARWLYVRVHERDGERFVIVLPIPLLLLALGLRLARRFVPQIEETGADQLVFTLREEIREGRPFFIEVNDEDGDEVRIGIY